MRYELIKFDGEWKSSGKRHDFESPPKLASHKGKWVPIIIEDKPTYNPRKAVLSATVTITEDAVTTTFKATAKSVPVVAQTQRDAVAEQLNGSVRSVPLGFSMLSEQARLFKRNSSAPVRMLKRCALKAGITPVQMRDKIITQSNDYEDATGDAIGQSDKLNMQINTILESSGTARQKVTALLSVI